MKKSVIKKFIVVFIIVIIFIVVSPYINRLWNDFVDELIDPIISVEKAPMTYDDTEEIDDDIEDETTGNVVINENGSMDSMSTEK